LWVEDWTTIKYREVGFFTQGVCCRSRIGMFGWLSLDSKVVIFSFFEKESWVELSMVEVDKKILDTRY
jgi:hypothetical protein